MDNGEELEGVEEIIKSLAKRGRWGNDEEEDFEEDLEGEIPETAL